MDVFDLFQRFALALGVGFLIGIERGWKQREEQEGERTAGLRTFTLIALLGAVGGALSFHLGPMILAALALAFALPFTWFAMRESEEDGSHSVTGVVAAILTFGLGAYAMMGNMQVAAAVAVATVTLLAFKQSLHAWLRALTWKEIRSALIILAASFIALPLLPDRAIDPWNAANPRQLWLLTILVAGASFVGYAALRAFGRKAGLVIGAVAGSIASSTVVTIDLARRARSDEAAPHAAAGAAAIATFVMLARVGALSAIMAPAALRHLLPALIAAGAVSLLAFLAMRRLEAHEEEPTAYAQLRSPLELYSVARFAALLCALTVAAKIIAALYGAAGLLPFAATAGLVDVDAVTLAVGGVAGRGLEPREAGEAILLAATANTVYKTVLGAAIGGRSFALWFAGASALALAAGAAAFFLIRL